MKTFFHLLLIFFPLALLGGTPPTISINPNPATVGELVTFTVNHNGFSCYEEDQDSPPDLTMLFPEGEMDPALATLTTGTITDGAVERLISESIWTYTYTKSGTFTVDFNCATLRGSFKGDDRESLTKAIRQVSTSLVVLPAPAAIPTMGEWGLIILALGLLIYGLVAIKSHTNIPAENRS